MSESPEPTTAPVATSAPVAPSSATRTEPVVVEHADRKSSRVLQAAAWVGIVAGTVFVIAVIFFSGFILGKHSDGGGHREGSGRHHEMMFERGGPQQMTPMRPGQGFGPGWPGGAGGPGMYGPGQGNMGPAQPSAPTLPTRP